MHPRLSLAAFATLAALAGPAPAQDGRIDESALRYYALQKQTARVEAETRRLRRLHPNWQPPGDLWSARPASEDEGPLWDMLAAGETDALRAAITARQAVEPAWRPSDHLAGKLRLHELRASALSDAHANRWEAVSATALAGGADVGVSDIELAWVFAEAAARTERVADATAILGAIVTLPTSTPPERLATIQKGMAFLPMAEAEKLIVLASARGPNELAPIASDITRARLSAFLRDEPAEPVTPEALAAFGDHVRATQDANQPGLLAWYAYKKRDNPAAFTWFKLAIARGGDAMIAHGLAHTLRRLNLARDAEEVAYAWREPLVNNAILFIDLLETDLTREIPPPIEAERVARYAQVTLATASGEGAQALAWYSHNTCQFETAVEWFRRAVAWYPKEATVLGLAVTLRRLKRQREFVEIVNRYDGLFPKVVGILFDIRDPKPLPCELVRVAAVPQPTKIAETGTYLDLAAPAPAVPVAVGTGALRLVIARVPAPAQAYAGAAEMPVVKRTDFPVAVSPENDLRFPSAGRPTEVRRTVPEGLAGLVARRVPGVGVMPYERFGIALLPAWNGGETPSSPAAVDRPPPVGSLWSDELAMGELSTALPLASAPPPGHKPAPRLETSRLQR